MKISETTYYDWISYHEQFYIILQTMPEKAMALNIETGHIEYLNYEEEINPVSSYIHTQVPYNPISFYTLTEGEWFVPLSNNIGTDIYIKMNKEDAFCIKGTQVNSIKQFNRFDTVAMHSRYHVNYEEIGEIKC